MVIADMAEDFWKGLSSIKKKARFFFKVENGENSINNNSISNKYKDPIFIWILGGRC